MVILAILGVVAKLQKGKGPDGGRTERVQKMLERIQAQQGGNVPIQFQGQFTQAAGQQTAPPPYGQPQQPQYPPPPVQFAPPQYQPGPYQPDPYQAAPYQTAPYHPAAPLPKQPTPRRDTDQRVRDLMAANNEVGAIRLLSDEQDMGILEAQQYARNLVAPPTAATPTATPIPEDEETRYTGSAAFADSLFNLDREENTWASGWVDTPAPEDRSDIEELWQTVKNPPRPPGTP
ncbi:hypothetical protein GCM10009534_38230 [Kribbella sandramycini]